MMNFEKIEEVTMEKDTAEIKTVIVWGQYDLLAEAVEHLLSVHKHWHVIRISDHEDETALASAIAGVNPDVLIVHAGVLSGNEHLLIKFVQDHSKLKIITLSLESNLIEIYNKHTICINQASDLLAAIQEDVAPDTKGGEIKNPQP